MTYEGALYWYTHNGATVEQERECESLVKEALEKQIPKKPIINKRKIQCVNGHNQPVQHYKYCPMCGQLMDWSDTE